MSICESFGMYKSGLEDGHTHEELVKGIIDQFRKFDLQEEEVIYFINNFALIKYDQTNIQKYVNLVEFFDIKLVGFDKHIYTEYICHKKYLDLIYQYSLIREYIRNKCRKNNKLNDDVLIYIGTFVTCITELNASDNEKITDACLSHLPSLQILDASDNEEITDVGLCHLPMLHTLNASENEKITDAGLRHLPMLHTLDASKNDKITDTGLSYLPRLHTLNSSCNGSITNAGLSHLPLLHTLNASGNTSITDYGIQQLKLQTLIARGSSGITDRGIMHMQLHVLDISYNDNISNSGLQHMQLHTLNLVHCMRVTYDGIKHMKLNTLKINRGNQMLKNIVQDSSIDLFFKNIKHLVVN